MDAASDRARKPSCWDEPVLWSGSVVTSPAGRNTKSLEVRSPGTMSEIAISITMLLFC